MKKGYKHPKQETYKPDIKSSHPGERILAARVNKPKGAVDMATRIKDKVGASTWDGFATWMVNEGIDRFKEEMESLSGKDYIIAYSTIFEYVKPKLIRNNNVNVNVDIDSISFE